jgi:hypothetical protein
VPVKRAKRSVRRPRGLVSDVASGATITLRGTGVYRITGTSTIQTILGVKDGDEIILLPAAAFGMNSAGNINPLTTTATIGRPIHLVMMNGTVYEIGPSVAGGGVSAVTAIGVSGGNTAGNTGTTQGTYYLQGGNNITLSQITAAGSLATLIVSGPSGGAGDGYNIIAAGTQTASTAGSVLLSNSNGITFGMSNSSVVTASHNGLTAQSVQTQNLHNVTLSGNTAGALAHISSGTMTLAGGNNITLSQAGNAVTISGANTVAQSVQPGIQSVSAGTTRVTTGEVVLSNSNGISFGANGQTITAAHNALTSQSNQALSGSNGSFTFQTATFGNLNGLSFYTSNGSLVGSYTVPAGGGGNQSIGMHTSTAGGATGGTSGSATGTAIQYNFYAGSNITLSQSVNGASGSLTVYGPSPGGGAAPTVNFWGNVAPANTGNSALSNAALVIWPLNVADIFPGNMTVSTMFLNMTGTVSTGASWRRTISLGFYTMVNSTQLSLCFSASTSFGTSAANASMATSFAGYRWLTFHSSQFNIQPTFSQTKYWFALWDRSTSGSQSFSFHGQSHFVHTSVRSGFMNAASNSATTQGWHPFNGNYSVSFSTAMPTALDASAINKTGATAVANFIPNIYFQNMGSNIL